MPWITTEPLQRTKQLFMNEKEGAPRSGYKWLRDRTKVQDSTRRHACTHAHLLYVPGAVWSDRKAEYAFLLALFAQIIMTKLTF